MSFENTSSSYNKNSIIESTTGDIDIQNWTGCFFKVATSNSNGSEVLIMANSNLTMCEFVMASGNFSKRIAFHQ